MEGPFCVLLSTNLILVKIEDIRLQRLETRSNTYKDCVLCLACLAWLLGQRSRKIQLNYCILVLKD